MARDLRELNQLRWVEVGGLLRLAGAIKNMARSYSSIQCELLRAAGALEDKAQQINDTYKIIKQQEQKTK